MVAIEVTLNQENAQTRSYTFDEPITQAQLKWVGENRHIKEYRVSEKTLYVTMKQGSDWETLEQTFIIPGLKKTFGQLKVNTFASR